MGVVVEPAVLQHDEPGGLTRSQQVRGLLELKFQDVHRHGLAGLPVIVHEQAEKDGLACELP